MSTPTLILTAWAKTWIASASDPVFGGVYKLVAVKQADGSYQPKMKCSDSASKAIMPGKKMPWRLYDENGQARCDLIAMDGERSLRPARPVTMVNLDPDAIETHHHHHPHQGQTAAGAPYPERRELAI